MNIKIIAFIAIILFIETTKTISSENVFNTDAFVPALSGLQLRD